jgi:hypothetical protein
MAQTAATGLRCYARQKKHGCADIGGLPDFRTGHRLTSRGKAFLSFLDQ